MADFCVGSVERPDVPDLVESCLTWTADGAWVVWAQKVARSATGDRFQPLTRGEPYPADAVARCRFGLGHDAPSPDCTCGFHAVSAASHFSPADFALAGGVHLDVALSGRVLAFEWDGGGVLFRAARQTVVRVRSREQDSRQLDLWTVPPTWPDDPDGVLAGRSERRPRGAGPVHIRLPGSPPANVELVDDAGYCELRGRLVAGCSGGMLAPV